MSQTSSKAVLAVTKARSKKGKLKGSSKKETKELVRICPHHVKTKKGKTKSTIYRDGDMCGCTMCKATWPAELPTEEQIDALMEQIFNLVNQLKFAVVALKAGDKACDYITKLAALLGKFAKFAKKIVKLANKTDKIKHKGDKHQEQQVTSIGSWGRR